MKISWNLYVIFYVFLCFSIIFFFPSTEIILTILNKIVAKSSQNLKKHKMLKFETCRSYYVGRFKTRLCLQIFENHGSTKKINLWKIQKSLYEFKINFIERKYTICYIRTKKKNLKKDLFYKDWKIDMQCNEGKKKLTKTCREIKFLTQKHLITLCLPFRP